MGRRARMKTAGALCGCGSYDIRHSDPLPWKNPPRPSFICGSCDAGPWTSGDDGEPYFSHAEGYIPHQWEERD